jgi:hypothetical protein
MNLVACREGCNQSGAQARSVPVKNAAIPEAPLGGHTTKLVPPPEPLREPEADRPPPVEAAPLLDGVAAPRLPPPPPDAAPAVPPADPVVELAVVPVDVAAGVLVVAEKPGVLGPAVSVDGARFGNAAAPPPAGNPFCVVALPTFPPVEPAVCANAGTVTAINRAIASTGTRVISRQRERSRLVPGCGVREPRDNRSGSRKPSSLLSLSTGPSA